MSTEMARNVATGQSRDFDLINLNSMGDGGRNPGLDPYLQKLGKIRGLDPRLFVDFEHHHRFLLGILL
jgi:hypothetical protein